MDDQDLYLVLQTLQVAELCRQATQEVGEADGVTIANYLCPGNYAVSGGNFLLEHIGSTYTSSEDILKIYRVLDPRGGGH